jgi:hypothetical protein
MTSYLLKGWNRDNPLMPRVRSSSASPERPPKFSIQQIPSVSPAAKTFRRTSLFPTSSSIEC